MAWCYKKPGYKPKNCHGLCINHFHSKDILSKNSEYGKKSLCPLEYLYKFLYTYLKKCKCLLIFYRFNVGENTT